MLIIENEPEAVAHTDELDTKLYHLGLSKARLASEQAHHDQLEADVVAIMEERNRKTYRSNGHRYTRRFSERLTFDELGLKKAMGAVAFNKLTERKLVRAKLNEAVATGILDPVVLSQHTVVKTTKPWIAIADEGVDDDE